jgi:hypothetical protein
MAIITNWDAKLALECWVADEIADQDSVVA